MRDRPYAIFALFVLLTLGVCGFSIALNIHEQNMRGQLISYTVIEKDYQPSETIVRYDPALEITVTDWEPEKYRLLIKAKHVNGVFTYWTHVNIKKYADVVVGETYFLPSEKR